MGLLRMRISKCTPTCNPRPPSYHTTMAGRWNVNSTSTAEQWTTERHSSLDRQESMDVNRAAGQSGPERTEGYQYLDRRQLQQPQFNNGSSDSSGSVSRKRTRAEEEEGKGEGEGREVEKRGCEEGMSWWTCLMLGVSQDNSRQQIIKKHHNQHKK